MRGHSRVLPSLHFSLCACPVDLTSLTAGAGGRFKEGSIPLFLFLSFSFLYSFIPFFLFPLGVVTYYHTRIQRQHKGTIPYLYTHSRFSSSFTSAIPRSFVHSFVWGNPVRTHQEPASHRQDIHLLVDRDLGRRTSHTSYRRVDTHSPPAIPPVINSP